MIQEYAAIQLGLRLGTYTHVIGSAHVNDRNDERVKRVLDEADSRPAPSSFRFPAMPENTEGSTIARVLQHEEALRTNRLQYSAEDIASLDLDPYWQQVVLLFELYRQIQHDQAAVVDPAVLAALHPGLRWLMERKWPVCTATSGGGSR
jgi:thymidylate synthase